MPSINEDFRLCHRYQIRNGLGVMPAFNEEVIPDEGAKNIVEYLKALRGLDKK